MTAVSVITVIKDPDERQLAATLDSVMRQSWPSMEIVIVDGGTSGAGERALARCVAEQDTRLVSGTDDGIYDALNKGLRCAMGTWIWSLNAGDTLAPNAVERLVTHALQGGSVAVVYCNYWFGGRLLSAPRDLSDAFDIYNMGVAHQAMIVPRALFFSELGFFRTQFHIISDHLWLRDARDAGVEFSHMDEALVHIDANGISSCATASTQALFEDEAVKRVTMRFPFVPDSVARDIFRFRSDDAPRSRIAKWMADAPASARKHPSWVRFDSALNAYFVDAGIRCRPSVSG